MSSTTVNDTGFTVLYRPYHTEPQVDIVFVHGLQGHPYKTWAIKVLKPQPESSQKGTKRKWKVWKKTRFRLQEKTREPHGAEYQTMFDETQQSDRLRTGPSDEVYWFRDLLPKVCPEARISTWGYNTTIVARPGTSTNKNHLYSHGKDLVHALSRHRPAKRPLIFVGHSLGGILVKEVPSLHQSADIVDILVSTTAVVFMGTPHRGSPAMAGVGESARKLASVLRLDTSHSVLASLGLSNSDLERCHEIFTSLWTSFSFRVKTFQEGRPLAGINLGTLNELVVPHSSSSFGDPRERAETLDLNHVEMCRFKGEDDPHYMTVSSTLKILYEQACPSNVVSNVPVPVPGLDEGALPSVNRSPVIPRKLSHAKNSRILRSLQFENMSFLPKDTISGTPEFESQWLATHLPFQQWLSRESVNQHRGLLWIKGKPGAGKSTLMEEILWIAARRVPQEKIHLASYFIDGTRSALEHSTLGSLRALIYQLLPIKKALQDPMCQAYVTKSLSGNEITWTFEEMRVLLLQAFTKPQEERTILVIDAIDECGLEEGRALARFYRELTHVAYKAGTLIDVCISSRTALSVSLTAPCQTIEADALNGNDIARYVESSLPHDIESYQLERIKRRICGKASGIFLWVKLVIDHLRQDWDAGDDIWQIIRGLDRVPGDLESLYITLVKSLSHDDQPFAFRLMQWVCYAARPIRVAEAHHILALVSHSKWDALRDWKMSDMTTSNDSQLMKKINRLTRGLLEFRPRQTVPLGLTGTISPVSSMTEGGSLRPRAGSFELSETMQPIHETVRQFFQEGDGFKYFDPDFFGKRDAAAAHVYILETCIRYASLKDVN
ncbi:hypothetical protein EJ05DRAFT_447026, partial [Pseudovirgaria hyperparasitica]